MKKVLLTLLVPLLVNCSSTKVLDHNTAKIFLTKMLITVNSESFVYPNSLVFNSKLGDVNTSYCSCNNEKFEYYLYTDNGLQQIHRWIWTENSILYYATNTVTKGEKVYSAWPDNDTNRHSLLKEVYKVFDFSFLIILFYFSANNAICQYEQFVPEYEYEHYETTGSGNITIETGDKIVKEDGSIEYKAKRYYCFEAFLPIKCVEIEEGTDTYTYTLTTGVSDFKDKPNLSDGTWTKVDP